MAKSYIFGLLLLVASVVAGAGSKDILYDNLVTDQNDVTDGFGFDSNRGWWIADDYVPDYDVTGNAFSGHWLYEDNSPGSGDLYFAIYQNDINAPPVYEFFVPAADVTETDSGMVAFGYDIYYGEMDWPVEVAFNVGSTYYIGMQMDTSERVYFVLHDNIIGDRYWFKLGGFWEQSPIWPFGFRDLSMALYWYPNAVEGASLGQIKASYR
ncbi:MAG: hypothetical protein GY771_03620 [bacterium]|nr:hypothetical protein [bacterium]